MTCLGFTVHCLQLQGEPVDAGPCSDLARSFCLQLERLLKLIQAVSRAVVRVETEGELAHSIELIPAKIHPFRTCDLLELLNFLCDTSASLLRLLLNRADLVLHKLARHIQLSQAALEIDDRGLRVQLQRENTSEKVLMQPAYGEDAQQQPPHHHVQVVGNLVKAGFKLLNELIARLLEGFVNLAAIL